MNLRQPPSPTTAALVWLLIPLIASCIILPAPVHTDVDRLEGAYLAADALVSAEPHDLLGKLSKRIEKANPELTVVDPFVFRDAAFPDGGWRVEDLLNPERCQRVAEELDVRFLVLVGGEARQARDEMGIMMPLMMPLGAMGMREIATLSAVVIDLETGTSACRLRSESTGVGVMLAWVIFVAAFIPPAGWAADRGLGRALAEFFEEELGGGPLRIAVMAAEAAGDPFVPYEGAPITVGRDVDVGEMVNRLAQIEADVIPGTSDREEIRGQLGEPMASDSLVRADVYRFGAIAARETRPLIYMGYFDWLAREARPYAGYLLVVYDADGKVVDIDTVFIADEIEPPQAVSGEFADRAAYDYSFPLSDSASVEGLRLEVEFDEERTRESLYTEPDGALVFRNDE